MTPSLPLQRLFFAPLRLGVFALVGFLGDLRPAFTQSTDPPPAGDAPSAESKRRVEAGGAATARGELDAAIQSYTSALELDPTSRPAWVGRANARAWKGELEPAIDDYRAALARTARDDSDLGVRVSLAEALLGAGKLDDAEAEIKTIEADPNRSPWSFVLRGQLALRRGDRDGAEAALREAAHRDPEAGNLAFVAATRLVQFGQYERALILLDAAELLRPANHSVHYWRGLALAAAGRPAEAAAAYRRYLEFDSSTEWAVRAREAIAELEPQK